VSIRNGACNIYRCVDPGCRLEFVWPQPSDTELEHHYATHYYGEAAASYENTPRDALTQILGALESRLGPVRGMRVLDFGSGVGGMVRLLRDAGAVVEAVEPDASARASGDYTGTRVVATLADLVPPESGGRYDLILSLDVVEHLRDPVATLSELRGRTADGGWLMLGTPNFASLKARLLGGRWEQYRNPTHLHFFTARSLASQLRRAGFRTVEVWRPGVAYPTHGPLRRAAQDVLQRLGLDGELRLLAA
jgi:2-polyprenyl-3-methyl-5-hydroxy-6-metoxy-1,4-benzoquinol methylase